MLHKGGAAAVAAPAAGAAAPEATSMQGQQEQVRLRWFRFDLFVWSFLFYFSVSTAV